MGISAGSRYWPVRSSCPRRNGSAPLTSSSGSSPVQGSFRSRTSPPAGDRLPPMPRSACPPERGRAFPPPADAALCMPLGAESVFMGSGIFKSEAPAKRAAAIVKAVTHYQDAKARSEEHTSELQSRLHLVCRLLL